MTEQIQRKLSDSKAARWTALAIVAFTMLCGYFLTDVMSPLKPMLEEELAWTSTDFGIFTSAYGWFNVFFLMLIFGGMILDKMGVRFTGMGSCILMLVGCAIKYAAVAGFIGAEGTIFGWKAQVALASLGYAIFGVGVEIAGITVSKVIVKWFKGKELALAMGLEMATARIGTMLAMAVTVPFALYRYDLIHGLHCNGPQAGSFDECRRGRKRRTVPYVGCIPHHQEQRFLVDCLTVRLVLLSCFSIHQVCNRPDGK